MNLSMTIPNIGSFDSIAKRAIEFVSASNCENIPINSTTTNLDELVFKY